MKSFRKELWFDVPTRRAFLNITPEVEVALGESGIREGLCLVKTTANRAELNDPLEMHWQRGISTWGPF